MAGEGGVSSAIGQGRDLEHYTSHQVRNRMKTQLIYLPKLLNKLLLIQHRSSLLCEGTDTK